jgi:Rrf2 family nitric oxide-sensitive transcriptional repressor
MRLTKTTSYAVRILVDCATAGDRLLKTAELSKRLDITPLNVFKIVHILSHAGFLEAVRGRNGGVRLARPATEIRIGEIVRTIESTQVEIESKGRRKGSGKRQLNDIFDDALEAFIAVLDQHTLADMAKGRERAAKTREVSAPVARLSVLRGGSC